MYVFKHLPSSLSVLVLPLSAPRLLQIQLLGSIIIYIDFAFDQHGNLCVIRALLIAKERREFRPSINQIPYVASNHKACHKIKP